MRKGLMVCVAALCVVRVACGATIPVTASDLADEIVRRKGKVERKVFDDFKSAVNQLLSDKRRAEALDALARVAPLPNLGFHEKSWTYIRAVSTCWVLREYARGVEFMERALAFGCNPYDVVREGFPCKLALSDDAATWDWLEKLATKKGVPPRLGGNLMSIYGYEGYKRLRPERARRALAFNRKRGVQPCRYQEYWLPTVRTFDEYDRFPRAEKDIVFPEAPKFFGRAKGKTVRVKDLGFNPDDMTAVIQKAIDDPTVGTLVFDKTDAPWRISTLKPRSNLVFVFEKGVRFLWTEDMQHWKDAKKSASSDLFALHNVSNVVFVGKGDSPSDVRLSMYADYETRRKLCRDYGGSAFTLTRCENIAIYNLTASDCACDGLSVSGLGKANTGIYVRDVVFESNLRQGSSLCNVDGIYFKNVAFNDTRGRSPMSGLDIEPSIQEVQSVCEIYLFDCSFKGNVGSHLIFSCSSSYPVTVHAKRCVFEPNANGNVEIFALPGIYFRAGVAAPSKIIFEGCRFRQHADKKAIRFANSSFFNVDFRDSTIEEMPPLRKGWERDGAPVSFELRRTYAKTDPDLPGKVVFDGVNVTGWKASPTIAFYDVSGTYSVTNLHGTLVHDGKKVRAEGFRHLSPETVLAHFTAFDPSAYAPPKKGVPTEGTTVPLQMTLARGGPWYEPKPKYQAVYWDGAAWRTRDADPDMKNLVDLAGKPVAFVGAPVMSWGPVSSDYSPAYQIVAGKDSTGATIYFEVPAGAKDCVVRLLGDAEIRDDAGRLVGAYRSAEDARAGVKYIRFKPASGRSGIYSVRIPKSASIKFFHPLTGVFAEKPEWLPRLKTRRP